MTTFHLALRGLLVLLAGLPLASLAGEPLIVVEDRGGASALPYYEALNLQPRANAPARPPIPTPQVLSLIHISEPTRHSLISYA
ncbi:integrating conjugative element protein, partial [Pseudomonas aeruginosa]|nr:integrating conjugative element protein [Pseudomonas aeruginosa]